MRWVFALVPAWVLTLAAGAYATVKHCYERDVLTPGADLSAGPDAYCGTLLREQAPGTFVVVTTFYACVAVLWIGIVVAARARRRRRSVAPA
ncbi:hypothetical protein [Cellulomonas sp. URHD0024]|uniref:hypothetical protein n=1 Tax=Cellulomonas sp. URHD0024 TaxID=1302620 RepID=UPI0004864C01|nr:hypothetical protein [Cellulomonas sp. URHD0024]